MIAYREHWLARTLIELADTLSDEFDLVELLTRLLEHCVEVLDAADAGIMLVDDRGQLQVMAATSEGTNLLELLELQSERGPCLDAYVTGAAIRNSALDDERWPTFCQRAREQGYVRAQAMPMRHGATIIGALNIFHADDAMSSAADLDIAQALADIATISVLHHRALQHATTLSDQLQHALQSRVTVEQAKGVLAERLHVEIDSAFEMLRRFSRNRNAHIADVARQVLDGTLPADRLVDDTQRRATPPASAGSEGQR